MSSELTFLDLCLHGEASADEIDDFVDQWHEAPQARQLHQFLGMTEEEYALWVRVPDALFYILNARREAKSLTDAVSAGCRDLQHAQRAADQPMLTRLQEWLKAQGQLT